jgi:DNA-binding MarR family transcriptional regulator
MSEDLHALGTDLISTAGRVIRWTPKERGLTVSLPAAHLLARLHDNGPARISDLANAERCSQPTVTNHVKRLETLGLVTRTPDSRDARAWMISVTEEGSRQLELMRSALGSNVEPYLASLSKRDRKAIRDGIEATHRLMQLQRPTSANP